MRDAGVPSRGPCDQKVNKKFELGSAFVIEILSLPKSATRKDQPFSTRIRTENNARERCEFRREKQNHIKIEEESYWTNGIALCI